VPQVSEEKTVAPQEEQEEPRVPALPPSGCYGHLKISSVVCEDIAEKIVAELGSNPAKVMLPNYPANSGMDEFDKTLPAKVKPAEAHQLCLNNLLLPSPPPGCL